MTMDVYTTCMEVLRMFVTNGMYSFSQKRVDKQFECIERFENGGDSSPCDFSTTIDEIYVDVFPFVDGLNSSGCQICS